MKKVFNASDDLVMFYALALVKLGNPFLNLLPEPMVVIHIGPYKFVHNLLGRAAGIRRNAVQFGL